MSSRAVAIAVCWGVVVLVWVAGALYNGARAPRVRARGKRWSDDLAYALVAYLVVVLVGARYGKDVTLDGAWVRVAGLVVLVVSTAFTLWARLTLSTMWSMESAASSGCCSARRCSRGSARG